MTERPINKKFDLSRYGLHFYPECKGSGKFLDQDEKVCVCSVCGGFGLIRKEDSLDPSEK
jgi:hypothetical protein